MQPPLHIVVVGSGLAGYGVLRELRKLAPECALTLICHDDGHFYSKPALSTALAKNKQPLGLITTAAEKMVAQLRFELRAGRLVEAIDRQDKILLTTGGPLAYDALVLAIGAAPIRPLLDGDAASRPVAINHLEDYTQFRKILQPGARVLIMGAGLVGSEFANDLALSGYRPISVDMQSYPLAQLVPPEIGLLVRDALAAEGVEFHLGRTVTAIESAGAAARVKLDDGTIIEADNIISAIGLRPNTPLAEAAGLEIGRGIKVDETGRTSDLFIYAIGDCAEYPNGVAAYVMPIMAAARGIAASILGKPTKIRFPPLSVQVKTSLFPIVLLPAPQGVAGAWCKAEGGPDGVKYLFNTASGETRGYVLTGALCEQRLQMDRAIGDAADARQAA